jgi:hypothetical protein
MMTAAALRPGARPSSQNRKRRSIMTTAAPPTDDAAAACQRLRDQLAHLKQGAVGEALPDCV